MLAKSPSERFASMKHVAEEIATLLRGSSTEKAPAGQEDRGTPATSIPKTSLHAALVDEARQRLKQRDYPKAIEMLQQIPEADRPPEAAKLLAQALKLMDEVNFVLQEMEAALQSRDGATLAKRAQELVKLKPDHPRARQVRELIKKHGPERALQFLAENSGASPAPAPPRRLLIGGLAAGLAVLFAIVWFQFGDSRVKVEILAEGYEVKFNEAEITITDGTRETKVKPGEHTLHIKSLNPGDGGTVEEFDTEKLTLKKGGQAVLTVTRENAEVVAKLDGQVIPRRSLAASATGQSVSDTQPVDTHAALDAGEKTLIYETSGELIENSNGAKAQPAGSVGWKVVSGQWNLPDSSDNFFADPNAGFFAGNVPSGIIEQVVDVSRFADAIDSENVEFKLSWKLASFDADVGSVAMISLDSNQKEITTDYDSGWQNHQPWNNFKRFDSSIVPAKGVRYFRLRVSAQRSRRPGNVQCSANIREISLRAVVKQPFTPPSVSDDGTWVSLFNGKDLANWKLHASQPGGWAVEDGLLVGRSWDTNHLFSESGDFENFHLRAELKTEHQSNGGIFIRSPFALDHSGKFPSGYEAQILHSHASGPWTGSLKTPGIPTIEQLPHERHVIAAGEWFTMDVIAVGNVFTVKVNGKTTTNIRDGSNLFPKGHIALQAMVNSGVTTPTIIHFKKIEVKRLKVTSPTKSDAPKPSAFREGEIDLLAAVDVSQLGDSDMKWERKGQTVVCTGTGTGTAGKSAWKGFRLPTEIGGDYEVELEFQQRAFWPMQIDFPLQDTALRVSLTGEYCDLMIEDDKANPNAERTWRSSATKLKTMVPQKLVVRVRQLGTRAEIEATLDGIKLGTYSGERSRLVLPSWVKPNVKQITSGSLCGNLAEGYIELRRAVYRPLVGTSLAVGSAATTIPFPPSGRFTASRPLSEINQGEPINAYPWITPDGMSLYWTRETQNVDSTVMQATRSSTDAPFGDIKPVLRHARLASVSPDGLEIICPFDVNGDGKPEELCTSRRATTSQEFPSPQAIPSLAGLHHALGSAFSEDGLKLIVLAAPQPNTTRIIHRVERSGPGAAWGTSRAVTIPNTPSEMDKITWPSLASGKYLIFSYQDPTNRPVEWGCVADATSDSLVFANPRHMLLNGERFIVRGGRYCPATGELFYTHSGTTPPFEKLEIRVARAEAVPATPPSNPEEGWTDLFNGRDLTGWTPMGHQGWRVENGVLIGETQNAEGWLMSSAEYDNFEFDFEYRLAAGTNSGIFLRAFPDGPLSGKEFLEVQVIDETDEAAQTMSASQRTGALYNTLEARPVPDLRPNLWHRMNIAIHEQDIRVSVNGQEVTRGKIQHGKGPRGHIGLQLSPRTQPQRCEFQKLRVRPLKDGLPTPGAPAQPNAPMAKIEPAAEQPVPEDPDEDSAGPDEIRNGLKAEIYAGQNFDRKVTERIEPDLDCFWNLAAPASGVPVDGFSVRFSGWLKAPKTGRYKLGFLSDDGLRVSLDGKKVIDDWKVGLYVREASVELTGQPQSILVETYDLGGPASLTAYWLPAGQATPSLIPSEALFPTVESARAPIAKSASQRRGLLAEYFDLTFQRKLSTHRVIRAETTWYTATPIPGLPTALAARYSGYFVPPTTGQYKLVGLGDDWMRVWIDNKPALEAKFEQGVQTALISLEAGKAHAIRIEHANSYLDGEYFLHWVEPGKTEEVSIPPECLFPTKAAANRAASKKPNIKTPEKPVEKVNTDELPEVQHGLKAEIFEGRNFEKKVGEQIEPNVECFWELGAPSKDAPVDNFSVRFTGWLRAPKTGRYKLFLSSKDGSRLKINHQTLIDNWKLKPEVAEVSLELTQDPQPIEVEVFNSDLYSWVSLLWQPAGTATVCHIPATALYPDVENARSKANRTNIEKTGLVAEYFDKSFGRRLATDRVYRIEEIWGPHSPRWGLPTDSAAKYTGILVPPVSGQYKLVTSARGHIRVWIDDKPTVEAKGIQTAQNAVVELEANKPHEIRVEVLTTGHGAHYLHWIPPGTTKEVSIPPECLFPNKAAVRQVTNGPVIKAPTEEKTAPSTISAAERETIERGLAQLKAADEAAGKTLLKAFDEQVEKVRSAPKLSADERVVKIKSLEDEKALFEKHGHIPFSLAMRTETLKYLREFTEARTDAAKVYDKLIESLTKQKKDGLASLLRTERDIAVGPKVVATWRTTEINGGKKADWTIWSNGSVGKPDRQFLWMMDESRFRIQWRPDPQWIDTLVVGPDSMKANIYNAKREHTINGERVAP
jgi:hypothetical protein